MGSIVLAHVLGRRVPGGLVCIVNKDIIGYCSAIAQARRMLKLGIICLDDFETIEHMLLKKYNLPLSSLFRDKSLIYKETRANISH